jgi:endoglucanase
MQVNEGGMATGLIGIPLRYMHSPCETVSLDDIDSAVKLLTRFIINLDDNADFTPSMENLHPLKVKAEPIKTDEQES